MGGTRRYVNQPEPQLKGASVTIHAPQEQVAEMQRQAQDIWPPALADLMQVQCPDGFCRQHIFLN